MELIDEDAAIAPAIVVIKLRLNDLVAKSQG